MLSLVNPQQNCFYKKMKKLLDFVNPSNIAHVNARERQKLNFDKHTKNRQFAENQLVLVKDFRLNQKVKWHQVN